MGVTALTPPTGCFFVDGSLVSKGSGSGAIAGYYYVASAAESPPSCSAGAACACGGQYSYVVPAGHRLFDPGCKAARAASTEPSSVLFPFRYLVLLSSHTAARSFYPKL